MLALFWVTATTVGGLGVGRADEATTAPRPTTEQVSPQPSGYADPLDQWLDEVKAQRRVWKERRRAAKEAINARRRLTDPWGAAQQEAREKESQRRHDAMLEQVERDRDAFRNQGPWQSADPWEQGPPPPSQPAPSGPEPEAFGVSNRAATGGTPPVPAEPAAYPPSGWDNRWYYRGY
jgi:hypothetical protein